MFWLVILLGAVQGLTEFLPVSSSGHLTLLSAFSGRLTEGQALSLELAVHVGSAFAVLVAYRKRVFSLFQKENRKTLWFLFLSAVPAGLTGVLFHAQIERFFGGGFVPFGFLLTALLLLITQKIAKSEQGGPFTLKTALSMGVMQAVAILPGLSRSGSTVFAGTLSGADREEVAEFSFLMSVPVILGGALFEGASAGGVSLSAGVLILGVLSAFLSSLIALRFMKNIVSRARYTGFAVYLFALGTVLLLLRFAP